MVSSDGKQVSHTKRNFSRDQGNGVGIRRIGYPGISSRFHFILNWLGIWPWLYLYGIRLRCRVAWGDVGPLNGWAWRNHPSVYRYRAKYPKIIAEVLAWALRDVGPRSALSKLR